MKKNESPPYDGMSLGLPRLLHQPVVRSRLHKQTSEPTLHGRGRFPDVEADDISWQSDSSPEAHGHVNQCIVNASERGTAASSSAMTRAMAMVVASQVKSFFGKRGNILEVDSYRRVDDLYTIFHQHVKTQFVIPALETVRQWFLARDWSNFYSLALQQLPVVRPCEQNDDGNEDKGLESIMTGRRMDLVCVTLVRCLVLDWDRTVPFADHVAKLKTLYSAGQQRWWHVVTHPLASLRHNHSRGRSSSRLSSCFSVDSIRSSDIVTLGSNSHHRGRRYGISPSKESNDDDDDDFDGFLMGPWTNSLLLHRSVAHLLWQAWRLTHLDHWTSAVLVQWKRDKSVLDATNGNIISLVVDTITTAIQQCRHPNGLS